MYCNHFLKSATIPLIPQQNNTSNNQLAHAHSLTKATTLKNKWILNKQQMQNIKNK